VLEDEPGAGLLAVTSADVLHRDWTAAGRSRWTDGGPRASTIEPCWRRYRAMPVW
jgi:pyruvate dehydrogenase E1 component